MYGLVKTANMANIDQEHSCKGENDSVDDHDNYRIEMDTSPPSTISSITVDSDSSIISADSEPESENLSLLEEQRFGCYIFL